MHASRLLFFMSLFSIGMADSPFDGSTPCVEVIPHRDGHFTGEKGPLFNLDIDKSQSAAFHNLYYGASSDPNIKIKYEEVPQWNMINFNTEGNTNRHFVVRIEYLVKTLKPGMRKPRFDRIVRYFKTRDEDKSCALHYHPEYTYVSRQAQEVQ